MFFFFEYKTFMFSEYPCVVDTGFLCLAVIIDQAANFSDDAILTLYTVRYSVLDNYKFQ